MAKDTSLDRLRQDLRSRNWRTVHNAFFKIATSSKEISDLDLLISAYVNLYISNKRHPSYLRAITAFVMKNDCYQHFSDILIKDPAGRRKIPSYIAKDFFDIVVFLKPENVPQLVERFLDVHLRSHGSSVFANNKIRINGLEEIIEVLIKSIPDLADKLFEEMKNSAERIGADYPFFLFRVFGDKGKEYLLERYMKEDKESWETDTILVGLSYFKDDRILEMGLGEIHEVAQIIDILKNHLEDGRARLRLAELLGSSNDFIVNADILRILADTDCDDIADKVLEKYDSLIELALLRARWKEDRFFAKFKAISEMFFNITTICGEKFKDKLLELAKSPRAEIRGPALHALGLLGEVDVLRTAFRTDKSKWSKFFISLGLILSQQGDAINKGMAFVNDFIAKIIPKGQQGVEFRKELIDFLKTNLGDISIPVSTILHAFADQRSMEVGIILLRMQLESKNSIRDLDELKVAIREGIQDIRDSPNYESARAALSAIMADINKKKNELLGIDITIDKNPPRPPREKGGGETYRKERRAIR